ncbi:MAG: glycosyltransferase [Butyrivibrio sp.]|nr:glycosyltransferase [Butyrivibrio sp.]
MEEFPMVTITLLTYNHSKYIRECLDGILMQETKFSVEVLIGDDCSPDNTQEIIKEYDKKYPGRFTPILRPVNIGATHNMYDLLKRAKGKYIAGLEGDDFWTDKNKLQMQVDFLESHPEYIGCSHEVTMIDENGNTTYENGKYVEGRHWSYYKNVYTYDDYQKFELPGQGSTYLYRNVFLKPKYDYSIIENASPMVGDMTLMLILASQGDWYYMMGIKMTNYRWVTTKGGTNWASWANTQNRALINFEYRYNLEQYAKKVLHKKLNLTDKKYEIFYEAFIKDNYYKSDESRAILNGILKIARPELCYWFYAYKKLYFDKIFLPTVMYAWRAGALESGDNRKLKESKWKDFFKNAKGKTVVAFGEGVSYTEFIHKYMKKIDNCIVLDNNKNKKDKSLFFYNDIIECQKENYDFSIVLPPSVIDDWDKEKFVIIITSTLYQNEIAKQLEDKGFYNYYSLGNMEINTWYYRLVGLCDKYRHRK